ncbi:MAG TPA: two-component regulator propeller domain-containing protein [Bacteroidia bacterium]|jgi:ligand-binding sensor domain-containing protein/serine phosphatase RsbU (regulator of sigma subunit)
MIKAVSRRSFLLFSVFIAYLPVKSQTYNFRIFNEDNGLPQGYIYHLSQDRSGFLYASTGEGFTRYSGNTFKVFRKEDGLAENFVTTHYIDSKSNIWLGHFQEGVTRFDPSESKFTVLKYEVLKNVKINCISEDRDGNILIGTQGNGLFKVSPDLNLQKIADVKQENINAVYYGSGDDLLVGTSEGLYVYNFHRGNKTYELLQAVDMLNESGIAGLTPSHDSSLIWVAANGKGVFSLKKSKTGYYVNSAIRSDLRLQNFEFRDLYCDHGNNIWVATFGEGLRKIIPADNEGFSYSVIGFSHVNGLVNDYIQSVYNDYEGNTWIGTYGSGLVQLVDEKFIFYPTGTKEVEEPVYAVCADRSGNLWLGKQDGLALFHPEKNANGDNTEEIKNNLLTDKVTTLYMANDGLMWIGTADNGIFTFDTRSRAITPLSKKFSLERNHINFITGDEKRVYVCTTEGLYIYNSAEKIFTLLETSDGLLHNNIYHVYVDKLGKLWLASHGAPLYNYSFNKVNSFPDIPKLRSFNLNNVCEDASGKIWFTTEGDGVFSYDGDKFHNYTIADGLASNYCYSIYCDNNNNVWIGHKNGISRKKEGASHFISYRKHEGILSPENNSNAVCADASGNIWFGTNGGLIKYDKEKDRFNTREPSTIITGMSIDNNLVEMVNDTILPYKKYSIKFDFLGICLSAPENVKYKYMLDGFESEWNQVDSRSRIATYPKLEEGHYTFRLLSCNNDGIWNSEPVTFSFTIKRPVWKSPWFFIFTGLVLTSLVYFLIRWRTRSLVRLSMRLERMVDEKTWLLKKEKENVEKINAIVEEQNRDITDSIHYAKRIQEAMLPSRKLILEKTNAFILYKPRDIVSGDFYWYSEKGNSQLIAVVDCTGHGVPGAFMSLIGSTLLNNIVKDHAETRPSFVMERLNSAIINSLHQDDQYSTKDGMEVALCSLDLAAKKLVFAGAGRPMYLVRNKTLTEFEGSIYSAGGAQEIHETPYEEHEVQLQPGDMIYIFSDGYADQFGGEKNRKFSTRALKELLVQVSVLAPNEQEKALDEAIMNWKKDNMQIDDILVLGIKID